MLPLSRLAPLRAAELPPNSRGSSRREGGAEARREGNGKQRRGPHTPLPLRTPARPPARPQAARDGGRRQAGNGLRLAVVGAASRRYRRLLPNPWRRAPALTFTAAAAMLAGGSGTRAAHWCRVSPGPAPLPRPGAAERGPAGPRLAPLARGQRPPALSGSLRRDRPEDAQGGPGSAAALRSRWERPGCPRTPLPGPERPVCGCEPGGSCFVTRLGFFRKRLETHDAERLLGIEPGLSRFCVTA